MGELTYTTAEAKKTTFAEIGLIRSDISFAEGDQFTIIRLKRSKTDTEHTEVQIILVATSEQTCPVAGLRRLFIQDPRPSNAPLFKLQSATFIRQSIVNILKQWIAIAGLPKSNHSSHSFQKWAAQHVADHSMLDKSIQRLGQWISNVFKFYFTTIPKTLFNLNFSFQKSMPLAVPRVVSTHIQETQLVAPKS